MTLQALSLSSKQTTRQCGAIALVALMFLCSSVHASGDDGPPPSRFVTATGTDVDQGRLETGHFGVLHTGWPRLRLYLAWRAIALNAKGLPGPVLPTGAMDRILKTGADAAGECAGRDCLAAWKSAAGAIFPDPQRDTVSGIRMTLDYNDYVECAPDAFASATKTLTGLRTRPDATPERLHAWVDGQDAVFSNCDLPSPIPQEWQKDSYRMSTVKSQPAPRVPAMLASSEAPVWREQREYQIAAALFHAGRLDEAIAAFGAIAAKPKHDMHQWGAYLALRAAMRQAISAHEQDVDSPAAQKALAQLQQRGAIILADPSLADLHEPTRATLRRARARLTPATYFLDLSHTLEDPAQQPMADDRLGDWRALGFSLLEKPDGDDDSFKAASALIDWISTIQACSVPADLLITGAGRPSAKALLGSINPSSIDPKTADDCHSAALHALDRWYAASKSKNAALARPWLVAYLMTTNTLPDEVRAKALETRPDAPEYSTLQAQLIRLARLTDDFAAERIAAAAGLVNAPEGTLDRPARNAFLRARFDTDADASSAIADLERPVSQGSYTATGKGATPAKDEVGIDEDGETWLDTRLSVEDQLKVVASDSLALPDRVRVAVAAWLRADFIGASALAARAAQATSELAPQLKPLADQYLHAPQASRHHVLLVGVLQFRLLPNLHQEWPTGEPFIKIQSRDDIVADAWCSIAVPSVVATGYQPTDPATPLLKLENRPVSGMQPVTLTATEIDRLQALPTATGMIGHDAISWARQHPEDPDVPWLLYVTVQSTRGGCLDKDAHTLSVAAYRLLHKNYPKSVWTTRTPYFF